MPHPPCTRDRSAGDPQRMSDQLSLPIGGEQLPHGGSAILHPSALSASEADAAYDELIEHEPWEENHITMFGRTVAEPRRSVWHADDGLSYTYSSRRRRVIDWSPLLLDLKRRCENLARCEFNGVLVNLYRDGHDHMGWHADDESNLGPTPVIASLSLGVERRFELRHRVTSEVVRFPLGHGSILVMSGECQNQWVHRLPKQSRVVAPRINLTFRHLLWGS